MVGAFYLGCFFMKAQVNGIRLVALCFGVMFSGWAWAESDVVLALGGEVGTVEQARDAARKLQKPVRIVVGDGVYEMTEPLVLGAEDSQTTWVAAEGARPVFSGGRKITGWQRVEGKEHWWKTVLPEVGEGKWDFQQLWVNGRRATRARTPNRGFLHIRAKASAEIFPAPKGVDATQWGRVLSYAAFITDVPTMALLKGIKPEEMARVSVTIPHSWDVHHYRIGQLHEKARAVLLRGPQNRELLTREPDGRFYVENFMAALDAPGEWFLTEKGELYYVGLPGEDLGEGGVEVVAPVAEMLLKADGVRELALVGISFRHQQWLMGAEGYGSNQAAQGMGAALEFDRCERVTLDQCEVAHVAGYGLWFHQGCRDVLLQHSHVHDLGAGGVRIGATSKGAQEMTSYVTLDNNIIQHGGRIFADAVGVLIGHSADNRVTHNDIGDFYYSGVSVGWHWGYGESVAQRNLVENNHIHHLGWGVTSDMGGYYGLGAAFGTVVRGNHIHHVSCYRYGGWGLYTDEGSAGVLMENNLVHDTSESAFHQHYGYYNTVRNNIFAFGGDSQLRRSRNEARLSFIIERNIVVWDPRSSELFYGDKSNWDYVPTGQRASGDPAQSYIIRNNLYWPVTGKMPELLAKTWSWDEWRKSGRDAGSLVADPMFEDMEKRDFRLKAGSPAEKIGFKPWDLKLAGVRDDGPRGKGWRAKALQGAEFPNWEEDSKPWPTPAYEVRWETFEYLSKATPTLAKQQVHVEGKGDVVEVTDEAASPMALAEGVVVDRSERSLMLQDAEGLEKVYNPHYTLSPNYQQGVVVWAFDVMAADAETPWFAEMRSPNDEEHRYKTGPRLVWQNGKLRAGHGDQVKVIDLPPGKWARVETRAVLGSGRWSLMVTGEDGAVVKYEDLLVQEGWESAHQVLWCSMATKKTKLFLDNLRLFKE